MKLLNSYRIILIIISLFEIFFLFQTIKTLEPSCNITHPILKNGKCDSIYCTPKEFNSSECIINNPIIKNQWLTNLIPISDLNFRYIDPVLSKNNDLIIQTTKSTGSKERKFFGIKKNGRYYFKDIRGEEYPYFSINVTNGDNNQLYMFENAGSIIQLENDDNDYFLSIGIHNSSSYTELIDFKNKAISRILTSTFYYVPIISKIGFLFELENGLSNNDNKKYYALSFLTRDGRSYYFMLKYYYFTSNNIESGYIRVKHKYQTCTYKKKVSSCFQAHPSNYIFCFFVDDNYKYKLHIYEPTSEMDKKFEDNIDTGENADGNENLFLKTLHLKENVGIFIYYKSISYTYPIIKIKEWDGNNNLNDFNSFGLISLNKYIFNPNLFLNDIIKLKENYICFSSTSQDKEILYIVVLYFYNNYNKLVIRYYTIQLYNLYNKKFLFEMKLINFQNYLTLTSSLCSNSICSSNNDEHYSYLIIFSYPNSTDIDFDLINHLINTNETISNININLFNNIKIENNIFGYTLKGIKILKIPEKIIIKSVLNKTQIYQNYYLVKNESISLSVSLENQNSKEEFTIEYSLILSSPEYNTLDNYITDIDETYADENEENNYNNTEEYVGRTSFFKIIKNNSLSNFCENEKCLLCYQDYNNICITCENDFYISNGNKNCVIPSISTLPKTTIPNIILSTSTLPKTTMPDIIPAISTLPKITIPNIIPSISKSDISNSNQNNEIIIDCLNEDIVNNKCNVKLTNEQIGEIYQKLKNNYLNENYTNENIVIITDNVAFQISTLEIQKNSDNPLISSIDIGECEKLLKTQENLNSFNELIMMKTDIKSEDYKYTNVQYEIYNPITFKKIDLNICKNISIYINTPVIISSDIENLYNSLSKSGYNIFNSNDSFYNDICSPYTSENGTDIPMNDRQNQIYNNVNNNTICQNNCKFVLYNSTTKKSKCYCEVQIEETITDINNINFKQQFFNNFFTTLINSNFLVLKCFKLLFSSKGLNKNTGCYIMSVILFIFIILMIIHSVFGNKKILNIIQQIVKQRMNMNHNLKNDIKNKKSKKRKINQKLQKKTSKRKRKDKDAPPKRIFKKKLSSTKNFIDVSNDPLEKKESIASLNVGKIKKNYESTKKVLPFCKKMKKSKNKRKAKRKIINNNVVIYNFPMPLSSHDLIKKDDINKKKIIEKNNEFNINHINTLNDQELNNLEYRKAIDLDKRTYFQYYLSLIKKKQLILFTFIPSNDYNLITIKIALFLFSFSLYFTINGFFFTDETMHNIYVNNGNFDIIFQIPQILYSTIITSFINVILKSLSLSENSILKIKNENEKEYIKKSKEIGKCLKIKFILFFIFSFLFMAFFWFFISCFCAVYKNTQSILIKDTLLSFVLSMIYPFGINLIPGMFRIPALRSEKRNKNCIYNFSKIIALI